MGEEMQGANPSSKNDDNNKSNLQLLNEKGASRKGKSCKGCLYYSSTLRSNSRNPVCVGFTRSLPKVPRYSVGESMEVSTEGRSLADFRYGCVGYSVYSDMKSHNGDAQETEKELPVCVGIEVLVDRKVTNANSSPTHSHNKDNQAVPQPRVSRPAQSASDVLVDRKVTNANSAPTHSHNKDNQAVPQPRVSRPAQSASDDFFSRFTRNANVVASGVAKNVRKVGNQIKESVDDILFPYRRRPK